MREKSTESTVIEKIDALKELFKFGGEIVPFVEELFIFLNDVLPLMESINQSLKETTANMPKAQDRISKASAETEAATQKIMDTLDSMNQKLLQLSGLLDKSDPNDEKQKIIKSIQTDSFDITYALQFQDITAQQLAHAQKILHTIYQKFQKMFNAMNSMDIDVNLKKSLIGRLTESMKELLDNSIEEAGKDNIRNEGISQDDIDILFEG